MKKILLILFILMISCSSVNKEYVLLSNEALEVIIPRYVVYVDDDPKLKREDKDIIIKSSQELLKLSREEKERVNNK